MILANAIAINALGGEEQTDAIVQSFSTRVEDDGGVVESPDCLEDRIQLLRNLGMWDRASAVWLPHGYKEGKLYAAKGGSGCDLGITRNGTRTRKGPTYVEQVPYNLFQYSEDFSNAAWIKLNGSCTNNATTAPDGTLTADKFVENTFAGVAHAFRQLPTGKLGARYSMSVYLKAGERTKVRIGCDGSGFGVVTTGVDFDLTLGTITAQSEATGSITSVGNGWYKCTYTSTPALTATLAFNILPLDATGTLAYTGDGVSGFYAWRPQSVEGTIIRDYFNTTNRFNVPALDYTGSTCPALSLEPARTNLLTYSDDFDNAAWTKTNATATANQDTGPDGLTTADLITITGASGIVQRGPITVTASTAYTFSWYVKRGTLTELKYRVYDNSNSANIVSPTSYYSQTNGTTYTRVTVTFTTPIGCTSIFVMPVDNSAVLGTCYLGGAQLEQGSYATSYIPTITGTVARIADAVTALYPERTNVLLRSENFSIATWQKVSLTIAAPIVTDNQSLSPAGTLTADKVDYPAISSGSDRSYLLQGPPTTYIELGAVYTASVYLKGVVGGEVVWLSATPNGTTWNATRCQLTTEWQRFQVTFTANSTTQFIIIGTDRRDVNQQEALPARSVYVWGAQLEKGTSATTYLYTEANPVHDGSVIGQTEGTLYFNLTLKAGGETRAICISDGTASHLVRLRTNSVNDLVADTSAGGFVSYGTFTSGAYKCAIVYSSSSLKFFVNGVLIGTDSTVTPVVNNMSRFELSNGGGTNPWYSDVYGLSISPTAISDAEAIALTQP